MRKLDFFEKKPIRDIIELVNGKEKIINYFSSMGKQIFDSSTKRTCEALLDIIKNRGEENCLEILYEYKNTKSVDKKMKLRYSEKKYEEFKNKLKNKPKPKDFSVWTVGFWVNRRGMSPEEARNKISELQKKNTSKRTPESFQNASLKCKHSLDYWISRGYTLEESEEKREKYLKVMVNTEERYIKKYGSKIGKLKFKERNEKWRKNFISSMNSSVVANRASKESLKFFVPLYKKCRKLGLSKNEIYFGMGSSREFFIRKKQHKNGGNFYDFTIPKLKIVVEYNGLFWHPREKSKWRNPWFTFEEAQKRDEERKKLCEERGFELYEVWSDSDMVEQINRIFKKIEEKYNG
jgi:very-short-patch-repair endonuclease